MIPFAIFQHLKAAGTEHGVPARQVIGFDSGARGFGRSSSRKLLLAVGLVLSIVAHAQPQPTVPELDAMVRDGQLADATFALARLPELTPEQSVWLAQKAHAGTPPFQYEYSRRLLMAQDVPGAVRWYARGYLARSLDFVECTDRGRNVVHMIIGTLYRSVLDVALKDRPAYAREIAEAVQ